MKPVDTYFQRAIKVVFWLFLIGSPILAYLVGMIYTDTHLRMLNEKVRSIPVYSNARLISMKFNYADSTFNQSHQGQWQFEYETEDDMNEVIAFYQRILPQSGWDSSPTGGGAYIYKSDDLSVLLFQDNSKPGNKTFFGLSIVSGYFSTLFDLRYSE